MYEGRLRIALFLGRLHTDAALFSQPISGTVLMLALCALCALLTIIKTLGYVRSRLPTKREAACPSMRSVLWKLAGSGTALYARLTASCACAYLLYAQRAQALLALGAAIFVFAVSSAAAIVKLAEYNAITRRFAAIPDDGVERRYALYAAERALCLSVPFAAVYAALLLT